MAIVRARRARREPMPCQFERRAVRAVHGTQFRRVVADPYSFDLDGFPATRQYYRPPRPHGRFTGADNDSRQADDGRDPMRTPMRWDTTPQAVT